MSEERKRRFREEFNRKNQEELERIEPELPVKYEYPLTRYILGWNGETWRIKPTMSLEDFEESPAKGYQYNTYKGYLGHSSQLNNILDDYAWSHRIPPEETETADIKDVFALVAMRTERLQGSYRP